MLECVFLDCRCAFLDALLLFFAQLFVRCVETEDRLAEERGVLRDRVVPPFRVSLLQFLQVLRLLRNFLLELCDVLFVMSKVLLAHQLCTHILQLLELMCEFIDGGPHPSLRVEHCRAFFHA